MTFILPRGNTEVPVITPAEASEDDVEKYELGAPTTEEDNTPSVILATMLEAPVEAPKDLKEIGRERATTVVDRPRPGGGTLLIGLCPPSQSREKGNVPKVGVKKITVEDTADTEIPDTWKDYL